MHDAFRGIRRMARHQAYVFIFKRSAIAISFGTLLFLLCETKTCLSVTHSEQGRVQFDRIENSLAGLFQVVGEFLGNVRFQNVIPGGGDLTQQHNSSNGWSGGGQELLA